VALDAASVSLKVSIEHNGVAASGLKAKQFERLMPTHLTYIKKKLKKNLS
jgi:hypothetical protein